MPSTLVGNIRGPQGIPGPVNWPLQVPQIPTPTTPPPAGSVWLYVTPDGTLCMMNSAGTEFPLAPPARYG